MTARKVVAGLIGTALIGIGVLLLVLPGPGLLLIALGVVVLSLEFEWANRAVERFKRWASRRRPGPRDEGGSS
jgi:hypothetical protein